MRQCKQVLRVLWPFLRKHSASSLFNFEKCRSGGGGLSVEAFKHGFRQEKGGQQWKTLFVVVVATSLLLLLYFLICEGLNFRPRSLSFAGRGERARDAFAKFNTLFFPPSKGRFALCDQIMGCQTSDNFGTVGRLLGVSYRVMLPTVNTP